MRNNAGAKKRWTGDLYEHRRAVQAGLLALLVIDAAFLFLVYRPLGSSFAQQRAGLEQLTAEAKARRETVARLKQIEASLGESNKLGNDFYNQRFLPAETGFSTIMEEVDKLAVANNVVKGGVNYSLAEVKDHPEIAQVLIDTSLEGDYSKVVRFVNQLEQSHLFLVVDSLGVGGGGPGKNVRLSVKLLTYFRAPKGLL